MSFVLLLIHTQTVLVRHYLFSYLCSPFRDIFDILLEQLAIDEAEKQLCFLPINGVVVDVNSVSHLRGDLAIDDGLEVAGYDFCNRHIMTAFHHRCAMREDYCHATQTFWVSTFNCSK